MSRELTVLLGGRVAGVVTQGDGGGLSLDYDPAYQASADALPVSLSMPLTTRTHPNAVVRAFCQGLLPDNDSVLDRWGRDFQVSPGNPFALLEHVGEDCAGAVQFVASGRVAALLGREGSVTRLTAEGVAERLRVLRRDPSAWHLGGTGQFSLAGAQAKTALHFDEATDEWGDPSGVVPPSIRARAVRPPSRSSRCCAG
jgi:serine/threonine-protein kinase HipA